MSGGEAIYSFEHPQGTSTPCVARDVASVVDVNLDCRWPRRRQCGPLNARSGGATVCRKRDSSSRVMRAVAQECEIVGATHDNTTVGVGYNGVQYLWLSLSLTHRLDSSH